MEGLLKLPSASAFDLTVKTVSGGKILQKPAVKNITAVRNERSSTFGWQTINLPFAQIRNGFPKSHRRQSVGCLKPPYRPEPPLPQPPLPAGRGEGAGGDGPRSCRPDLNDPPTAVGGI